MLTCPDCGAQAWAYTGSAKCSGIKCTSCGKELTQQEAKRLNKEG